MSNDGYRIKKDREGWTAVFEFDASQCEAIANAFGPMDGAYSEHMQAANELRRLEARDQ